MPVNTHKILILVTQDHGGAGEGMYKVAKELQKNGNQVALLVKNKIKNDDFIFKYEHNYKAELDFFGKILRKLKKTYHKINKPKPLILDENYYFFGVDEVSINVNPDNIFNLIGFTPNFIISGWTSNFINSSDLLLLQQKSAAKIYTIAVDMNHYTGGCHYAWDCDGYINGCTTNCPAIQSESHKNLAKNNFDIKFKNAQLGNFKMISGSGWTLNQTKASKIYKNQENFPNINSMIDMEIMKFTDKKASKAHFNLSEDKFYILMGCQNAKEKRKGFDYLLNSLKILYQQLNQVERDKISVIVVSEDVKSNAYEEIPFEKTFLKFITDYNVLSLLYQASDVFVNSSIEDSGPMMVTEALACGTPVVGFDMGVVNNLVINKVNGYKAILKDENDLANGIKTIFNLNEKAYQEYSKNAIDQVKKYSSLQYGMTVFEEILNS